eukprot:1526047-Alexandrium_andersonii.AAC.1
MGVPIQVTRDQAPIHCPPLGCEVRQCAVHPVMLVSPPKASAAGSICQDWPAIASHDNAPPGGA